MTTLAAALITYWGTNWSLLVIDPKPTFLNGDTNISSPIPNTIITTDLGDPQPEPADINGNFHRIMELVEVHVIHSIRATAESTAQYLQKMAIASRAAGTMITIQPSKNKDRALLKNDVFFNIQKISYRDVTV